MSYIYGFDTGFYQNLINKDEKRTAIENAKIEIESELEVVHAEIIDEAKATQDFLNKSTYKGLPPPTVDAETNDNQSTEANKASESPRIMSKIFELMNQQHGFDIKFNSNSFIDAIEFVINPKNKRIHDLYISEITSQAKSILLEKYLTAVMSLTDQLTDPTFLKSKSMPIQDKFSLLEQMFEFAERIIKLEKEVHIPDAELKLKKLAESTESKIDIDSPAIRDFLDSILTIEKLPSN